MTIRELQKKLADALNGVEELVQGGCKAFAEDTRTVYEESQQWISGGKVAIVVVTPDMTRNGCNADGIPADTQLMIRCVERAPLAEQTKEEPLRGKTSAESTPGSFAPSASSSAPSGRTEIRAVISSPTADSQARKCGYADVKDMMAKAETVAAERMTAIQAGYSGKCKAHEAIAVISANEPFKDAESNSVKFAQDIIEHYVEGRSRRDNMPKVSNLEDLPYAIKAVKTDTYGVSRMKYPRGTTPDPLNPPRGTQREYHLTTDRGQMKVFVYIQGGLINGWNVEG